MRWLIRRVLKRGKGSVSYEDDIHYGQVLTIGRGSDQAIFVPDMRVALEHARITAVGGGKYKVESLILAGIRVNDEITYATTVGPGAMVEVGTTRIQLLEPPVDYEAGCEVSTIDKAEIAEDQKKKALPTQLSQTWLAKRAPSWTLFAIVALFGLVLPMLAHYSPGFRDTLAATPLPQRTAWEAGELASAHHFFGENCGACHDAAFKWVRDESCAACHGNTPAHADPVKFNLPELGDARCAHCHRDHNGQKGLVRDDQILCDDCHRDLKSRTGNASTLADVADFGTAHPEFMVNLPAWTPAGEFAPKRTLLAAGLQEQSGLEFPHDVHLDPKGLNTPGGIRKLECESCHVPDQGQDIMKPVDFETMCQDCHRLDFDVLEPERQVPHGKVPEVIYMLDEFYARRALEGGYNDTTAPIVVQQRRRPGQSMTRQEQVEALAWARDKARTIGESLFTGRACTTCHAVSPGKAGGEPWIIAPVRVAGIWYAKSHFTHDAHDTTVDSMTCESCHAARESKAATDLLIPGIDNCRQCHGGEASDELVPTTCIQCHAYHEHEALILSELQARSKSGAAPR
jgi:hypothetical protein